MLIKLIAPTLTVPNRTVIPSELQLIKNNTSDTEASYLDLRLLISYNIVSNNIVSKIHNECDAFDFGNIAFFNGTPMGQTSDSMAIPN